MFNYASHVVVGQGGLGLGDVRHQDIVRVDSPHLRLQQLSFYLVRHRPESANIYSEPEEKRVSRPRTREYSRLQLEFQRVTTGAKTPGSEICSLLNSSLGTHEGVLPSLFDPHFFPHNPS